MPTRTARTSPNNGGPRVSSFAASPNGTFGQAGNVWEWNKAIISGSFRGLRGGGFRGVLGGSGV